MLQENCTEDTVKDYFHPSRVELNCHSLSEAHISYAAGATELEVNMDCPPCSCVINMHKICVAVSCVVVSIME